jgi:Ca2+-binding RTX toxin-like protein
VPAYAFETITTAQAVLFLAASDSLSFASTPDLTARSVTVAFDASGAFVTVGNRSVSFGAGFVGYTTSFSEGTKLLVGAATADDVSGSPGADQLLGGEGADTLLGLDGGDSLNGGSGNDVLQGGAGNDTLEGGRGDDSLDGGPGIDTLVYTSATSAQVVNLETAHTLSFDATLGMDTLTGIENVITGEFNDAIRGDAADNRLIGLGGADSLVGGAGADTLDGGMGGDSIDGGDGDDWIVGGRGVDTLIGGADADTYDFSQGDSPIDSLVSEIDRVQFFLDDRLLFRGGVAPTEANYIEVPLGLDGARAQAQALYAQGYEYIAVQVGGDVEVFAPRVATVVYLANRTLDIIYAGNIVVAPATASPPSAGADVLTGVGNDTIDGLAGADTITETGGVNYLRGGDGNDSISGGVGFDDINGNQGNDTCVSGGGDDWVVGGKDNDSLTGSAGQNLVYGNLGADTCEGGGGNDIVRGGQDNDIVSGGAGDDFVSGDKGSDTVTGGAGADIFHTFGDAGVDRVTDFSLSQGDRVQLDPGTVYTVSQVGADTVINMSGGGQMTLLGVQMSTLTPGWIFGA